MPRIHLHTYMPKDQVPVCVLSAVFCVPSSMVQGSSPRRAHTCMHAHRYSCAHTCAHVHTVRTRHELNIAAANTELRELRVECRRAQDDAAAMRGEMHELQMTREQIRRENEMLGAERVAQAQQCVRVRARVRTGAEIEALQREVAALRDGAELARKKSDLKDNQVWHLARTNTRLWDTWHMHECACVRSCARMRARTHARIHARTHARAETDRDRDRDRQRDRHTHTHTQMQAYVHGHARIHTRTHAYTHAYMRARAHTHTRTHAGRIGVAVVPFARGKRPTQRTISGDGSSSESRAATAAAATERSGAWRTTHRDGSGTIGRADCRAG